MSTRCYIAKQIGADQYLTIFCHVDGFLEYNGALLNEHYNTPEKVDELLGLGDLWSLGKRPNPDPEEPHNYEHRQKGVTVAYGRDFGDTDSDAAIFSLEELDDPEGWIEYVYIFTQDNRWKYFENGCSEYGFRDVAADLEWERNGYETNVWNPPACLDECLEAENEEERIAAQEQDEKLSPELSM